MDRPVDNGDICEVVIHSKANDQVCLNSLHYRLTGAVDGADGTDLAFKLGIALNSPGSLIQRFAAVCSDLLSIENLSVQWIYGNRYTRQDVGSSAVAGLVAGGMLPQNVSIALYKTTEVANRRNRGFFHLPGCPISSIVSGETAGAARPNLAALGNVIKAAVNLSSGETMSPCIFNRTAPQNSPTVLQCVAQTTLRVIRRRTVGVGI